MLHSIAASAELYYAAHVTDITNFHNYVTPFPNYYVLGPNIKYFVEHGVVGLYEEGNGHGPGSDLDALKAYVTQSMMWQPDTDDKVLIATFLDFYYGKEAAPFVRLYMDIMHGVRNTCL